MAHLQNVEPQIHEKHTMKNVQNIIMVANKAHERASFQQICCNPKLVETNKIMARHAQSVIMVANKQRTIVPHFCCNTQIIHMKDQGDILAKRKTNVTNMFANKP